MGMPTYELVRCNNLTHWQRIRAFKDSSLTTRVCWYRELCHSKRSASRLLRCQLKAGCVIAFPPYAGYPFGTPIAGGPLRYLVVAQGAAKTPLSQTRAHDAVQLRICLRRRNEISSSYLRYGRCDLVDIIKFIYFSTCYNHFDLSACHIT
jgi:hypothetical protein